LFTLGFLLCLALDLIPGLRGGAGWHWPYAVPARPLAVLLLALALGVYGLGAWALAKSPHVVAGLAWAVIGGILLAYAVTHVQGDAFFTLFTRTVSPVQTGASALAVRVMADAGALATLARWPDVMRASLDANLIHFTTSPPGAPLLHHALAQAFDAPALAGFSEPVSRWLRAYQCADPGVMQYTRGEIVSAGFVGLAMPLLAALAAPPIYAATHQLTGDRRRATWAALWWPLLPTILMFAPTWNTLYPALCALAFALLLRGLGDARRHRPMLIFAAGLVMSITTFLNFSVLPAFLLFGLFTLSVCVLGTPADDRLSGLARAVRAGLIFGAGLLVVWVIFALATGLTPLDLLRVTFEKHSALVQRDYLPWLILHPYDTLMFIGWPLAALAIWRIWQASRRGASALARADLLALALALTVLLVNFAGIVQGENARILAFYAPFFVIVAVGLGGHERRDTESETEADDEARARPYGALFIAQALTVLVMGAVLPVVPLDLNPQPTGPRADIGGLGEGLAFIESGARFASSAYAGAFTLDRYRFIADPSAQAISFEFAWRGETPTERPYQFEMVATAENPADGVVTSAPFRWTAQGGNYPPTCWRAGDSIRDTVVLPLPPVSQPVVWTVVLRAFDARTGDFAGETTLGPVRYP
jgi:hypothetical protein